jgi:hypothetical protein
MPQMVKNGVSQKINIACTVFHTGEERLFVGTFEKQSADKCNKKWKLGLHSLAGNEFGARDASRNRLEAYLFMPPAH